MNALDRFETAMFQRLDAAVQWVWDEWGIKYRSLYFNFGCGALPFCAVYASDFGSAINADFWLTISIMGSCLSGLMWSVLRHTPDTHNLMSEMTRMGVMHRISRFFGCVSLIISAAKLDAMGVSFIAYTLLLLCLGLTKEPTEPRNPKKRHSAKLALDIA